MRYPEKKQVESFIFLLIVLIVWGLPPIGCKKKEDAKVETPLKEVSVMTVKIQDEQVFTEFVAQTQSSQLVNIQARVSGFLEKRLYEEGSVVKEGQALFKIDDKPFKVQLDQAKAALSEQKASLETARLNLERVKPLVKNNALSQKDLDSAVGQYQSLLAAVEQAKARVNNENLNLSYTTITSPVAGVSSSAREADGTYINAQNSLLTTVEVLSPMWVNFSLSENDMQKYRDQVKKGLLVPPKNNSYEVEIVLVDGSIFPHKGRITFAEPSFNPQTGTFLIRASVKNPDGSLRPNQYVRARLKGAIRPNAILIPQRSVQQDSKSQFVWVVQAGSTVEKRPVKVGNWHDDNWFILEGLKSGDQVVVDGLLMLQAGMKVNVKTSQPENGAGVDAKAKSGNEPIEAAGTGK